MTGRLYVFLYNGGVFMAKYVCKVCGYVHEGELTDDFKCPVCGAPATEFQQEDETSTKHINPGTNTEQY